MRRTKLEAEETKRKILDSGLQLFMKKGVTSTSLEEIAKHAGVTRGAVYWHFKNKIDLFNELVKINFVYASSAIEQILTQDLPALQKITGLMRTMLYLLAEDEGYRSIQKILCYKVEIEEEIEERMARKEFLYQQIQTEFEKLFWQAQHEGKAVAHLSPKRLASSCLSIIGGFTWMYMHQYIDANEFKKSADAAIFVFMKGIQ